jgi:hypothetical protein
VSLSKKRREELLAELQFLDMCELLLAYASKTEMAIYWNHPRVSVKIKQAPKAKKVKP